LRVIGAQYDEDQIAPSSFLRRAASRIFVAAGMLERIASREKTVAMPGEFAILLETPE